MHRHRKLENRARNKDNISDASNVYIWANQLLLQVFLRDAKLFSGQIDSSGSSNEIKQFNPFSVNQFLMVFEVIM